MPIQTRKSFLSTLAVVAAGLSANVLSAFSGDAKGRLTHHVFFWLNNPASSRDRDLLLAGLQTLRKIKVVKKAYIGVPAATEKREVVDNSYDVSELLFFNSPADQKAYQDDPLHQQFVARYSHLWRKVVVYDVQEV